MCLGTTAHWWRCCCEHALRDERYSQPVGCLLGAIAGAGLELCRQRDDYAMAAAGKTEFDEDI